MINFILIYFYLTFSVQQPIELIYADELSGSATTGVEYRKVSGKVHFEQGNVVIKCDIANHFMAENKVELFGNVVITQEDLVLKANSIYYDGNTGIAVSNEKITITDKNSNLKADRGTYSTKNFIAEFIQNVSISDVNSKITTDKLIHNRKTQFSQCFGNVKVENDSTIILSDYAEHNAQTKDNSSYGKVLAIAKYSNIFLNCDTLLSFSKDDYAEAIGHPILCQIDTIGKKQVITKKDITFEYEIDTLFISSKSMDGWLKQNKENFFFRDSVEIAGKRISGTGEDMIYNKADGNLFLFGKAKLYYDSSQIHSDTITIFTKSNKLDSIFCQSNAIMLSKDDTLTNRINQISGNTVWIHFAQDTIRKVIANGEAKSLYFLAGDDGNEGAPRLFSDRIEILFESGEPSVINWLGAIEGEFFPENIVEQKGANDYYLPNFFWIESKPQKKFLSRYLK